MGAEEEVHRKIRTWEEGKDRAHASTRRDAHLHDTSSLFPCSSSDEDSFADDGHVGVEVRIESGVDGGNEERRMELEEKTEEGRILRFSIVIQLRSCLGRA